MALPGHLQLGSAPHPKHQALSQYTRVDHVPQVGLGETANHNTETETKEIDFLISNF